jgi:5'-3' exonuclease
MASQCPNIYLLREADQFNHGSPNNDVNNIEEELCFADIDRVKESINKEFNGYVQKFMENLNGMDMFGDDYNDDNLKHDIESIDFTDDYIFICYFLGNDFLPHLPSIDIKIDGLELIFRVYVDVYQTLGKKLITLHNGKVSIDRDFLIEFISILSQEEENFFKSIQPTYLKQQQRRRCFETEPYKRAIWRIENLKEVDIIDKIRLGDGEPDEWKFRYYNHYFNTSEHMEETVNDICQNYFEGLVWVARYYFESCPTWRWQYKYTHAPFLSDLLIFIKTKNIMDDFNVAISEPIDMYTQLVSVIPATYAHILPSPLQDLNSSPKSSIIDMYPIVYNLDMINKTQLYKCIPIIPYLDLDRVIESVNKIKLSALDIEKSKKSKIFNLGTCKK